MKKHIKVTLFLTILLTSIASVGTVSSHMMTCSNLKDCGFSGYLK